MAEVMCQRSFTAIFASRSRATGQVRNPTLYSPRLFNTDAKSALASRNVRVGGRRGDANWQTLGRPVHSRRFSIAP